MPALTHSGIPDVPYPQVPFGPATIPPIPEMLKHSMRHKAIPFMPVVQVHRLAAHRWQVIGVHAPVMQKRTPSPADNQNSSAGNTIFDPWSNASFLLEANMAGGPAPTEAQVTALQQVFRSGTGQDIPAHTLETIAPTATLILYESSSASNNCHTLAAGQVSSGGASTWWAGYTNASLMFDQWLTGSGPTDRLFGPSSPESQQMLGAYGLASHVSSFLSGGASSGFQNFGARGALRSRLNPTAQFVGSYGWSMSLSGGSLKITLTNATTMFSFFYHAPGLSPNPPTLGGLVLTPGTRLPMGRVNQTFIIQVPCS